MEIGVLGTGMVGRTIGSKLIQLGHDVFMGARDADNPKAIAWAKEEGQRALYGTFTNAAAFGEIIFNCTLGSASLDALRQAGADNLKGKILIDTSNPIDYSSKDDLLLSVCNGDSLGEQIQKAFPNTFVIKALNTMNCNVMIEPTKLPERTDVFVSGNDIEAKTKVIGILRDWFGWRSIIDLGDITTSRGVEMLLPLWFDLRRIIPSDRFNIRIVKS